MSDGENAGDSREVLFTAPMRKAEWSALLYEAHYYLAALLLGASPVLVFFWTERTNYEQTPEGWPIYSFATLVMIGLGIVFWSATFYPVRVMVKPGAIRFKMILGSRNFPLSGAVSARAVSREEVKHTLRSPRFRSLSPALSGTVMIATGKSRPWVFSLDDPEAFLRAVAVARREV